MGQKNAPSVRENSRWGLGLTKHLHRGDKAGDDYEQKNDDFYAAQSVHE